MDDNHQKTQTKKCSRKAKIGRFIQKTLNLIPGNSHENLQNLYRQHMSANSLVRLGSFRSSLTDHWHKRALRNAVHSHDQGKLKALLSKGIDIHIVISEAFLDTPLTCAVKCGYLDIVELLLRIPGCKVDHIDRYKHSVLDEAICSLLLMRPSDTRKSIANRYRIIKCLLCAGAKEITHGYIDTVIFSVINTRNGRSLIQRMVKVVAENGGLQVKSTIISLLIPYQGTITHLKSLLKQGADPCYFEKQGVMKIPVLNALLLVRYGSSNKKFLQQMHNCTSENTALISSHWSQYQLIFRLLIKSGLRLRLNVMNYLYNNHASFYIWIVKYEASPMPLLDICRNTVRCQFKGNMLHSAQLLQTVPESIKSVLLLE